MDKAITDTAPPFSNPDITADGERRASVDFRALKTLWFNTGTLCNIDCSHCYIESSPRNDRLVYLRLADILPYLDDIRSQDLPTREIGLTGGEPFMNPDIIPILSETLARGFDVLVLTNAMKPMHHHLDALAGMVSQYGDRLTLRVSLDHYTQAEHEKERGANSWGPALEGLAALAQMGARIDIAGRSLTHEDEAPWPDRC